MNCTEMKKLQILIGNLWYSDNFGSILFIHNTAKLTYLLMDFSDTRVQSSFNLITGPGPSTRNATSVPEIMTTKLNCLELHLPGNPYLGVNEVIVGVLTSVY